MILNIWRVTDGKSGHDSQSTGLCQAIANLTTRYDAVSDVGKTLLGQRLGIDCGRAILPNDRLTANQRSDVIDTAKSMGLIVR